VAKRGSVADAIVCGKALGGGLPLSACLLRPKHAEAWNLGPEAVSTHTHMGNPLACAAALVVLETIPTLLARVQAAGERLAAAGWDGAGAAPVEAR
jgi:4-aminobutyrate aminotransferase-like enzyme